MSTNTRVNCSGALFSCLQYELINNKKLQEGFLLGHVEKFTSHSISDTEINNENTNVVINVSGYIPCSSLGSFYSGCGRVNFQYLKQYVEHNMERVVGWYHSRRFSDTVFLKEMRIHEQLREEMPHTDGHFLFAIFSRVQPAESGTMDVSYKFQIMLNNNEFEGVPLRIVNMNDTSTSQYIRAAPAASLYNSKSLQTILEGLKNMEPGIKEAEQLHNGLLNQLRNLLPKYACIQEQHNKVLQEVNKLHEFCYSSEVKPDFRPNEVKECDFDLMDLESSNPKFITRQVNGSTSEVSHQKNVNSSSAKKNDPFGFVEKEMEKHQENGTVKKKSSKIKKEQSANSNAKNESENEVNTPKSKSKPKVLKKNSLDAETRVIRSSSRKGGAAHSPSSSPCRKNSKENISLKNQTVTPHKTKSLRGVKLNSLAEKSPSPNARHRSPSIGVKNSPKIKEKEAWTDNKMRSDSPEF